MNLNQITVPSLDIDRSVHFYKMLGLKPIVLSPHYARFECPAGEATFSVHLVDDLAKGEGVWVYFELDNLDEQVSELRAMGMEFEELPQDKPWLWREARLRDPFGNLLVLYHAGTNRKNPPWRVQ